MFNFLKTQSHNKNISSDSNIVIEYNFKREFLKVRDLLEIINSNELGFIPKSVTVGGLNKYDIDIFVKIIKKFNLNQTKKLFSSGIYIADESNQRRIIIIEPIQYIYPGVHYIRWITKKESLNTNLFSQIMRIEGFVVCYAMSEIDEFMQNEEDIEAYKSRNLRIPKDKIQTDAVGRKTIRIEGNPGRFRTVRNMRLRSCWSMWFGEFFFELISREKIINFIGAYKKSLLENKIYYIELYENPFEANLLKNRKIQLDFNLHIEIESTYEKCFKESGLRF